MNQNMKLISGIPPWMQMYFDRLQEKTGKRIGDLFPNFSVMVQGGVNFEPYKAKLFESIGRKIDCIELFPASEGILAVHVSKTHVSLWWILPPPPTIFSDVLGYARTSAPRREAELLPALE